METERLFECNGVSFGFYSLKSKYTGKHEWRNEIHKAGDTLIQGGRLFFFVLNGF
jgi:hypothetical protein